MRLGLQILFVVLVAALVYVFAQLQRHRIDLGDRSDDHER